MPGIIPSFHVQEWKAIFKNNMQKRPGKLRCFRSLRITREIAEIQAALETGAASYTLQFSVKCKQNLLRTIIED